MYEGLLFPYSRPVAAKITLSTWPLFIPHVAYLLLQTWSGLPLWRVPPHFAVFDTIQRTQIFFPGIFFHSLPPLGVQTSKCIEVEAFREKLPTATDAHSMIMDGVSGGLHPMTCKGILVINSPPYVTLAFPLFL